MNFAILNMNVLLYIGLEDPCSTARGDSGEFQNHDQTHIDASPAVAPQQCECADNHDVGLISDIDQQP